MEKVDELNDSAALKKDIKIFRLITKDINTAIGYCLCNEKITIRLN